MMVIVVVVERETCVVRYSAGCKDQPYNWVHREGRERERVGERSPS
jgi:hypothetical protein